MDRLNKDYIITCLGGTVEEINHFKIALDDELAKLKIAVEEFKKKRDYIHDFIDVSSKELHKLQILVSKIDSHLNEVRYTIEEITEEKPCLEKNILKKIKELIEDLEDD